MSSQMATDAARRKRDAARDFLRSAVMPLIEEVLVKKFCQTMDVIAEGRERAEPPVVNESFTAEPVGEIRFDFGPPSSVYAELYSETLPLLAFGTKLYAAPQPSPDVSALVDALEDIAQWSESGTVSGHFVATIARKALAAYRQRGGE